MPACGRTVVIGAAFLVAAALHIGATTGQELVSLGGCPEHLAIQRTGIWANAEQFPAEQQQALAASAAAGGHPMVAAYLKNDKRALVSITYDASLDPQQGSFAPEIIERFASIYSPEGARQRVKFFSDSVQRSFPVETYDDDAFSSVTDHDFFATDANSNPQMGALYWVQGEELVDGCLVELRFGFAIEDYNFADVIPYARQIVLSGVVK